MIMRRRLLSFLFMVILIFSIIGCTEQTESIHTEPGYLKVHFIDVGQADAILIQQQDQYMLIDAGNNGDADLIVNYLEKQGVKKLQYVIGTHPHEDHVGSLDTVINTFDIENIMMPKATANTKTFEDVISAIKSKGLKITTPKIGDQYTLNEGEWRILAPSGSEYKDINNYSIVIKYTFGEHSFLFTGDAEEQSEEEILSNSIGDIKSLQSDILKIGHHGSNSSTSEEFLNAVNPRYAVISAGKDNKYGHPHKEILDRLTKSNIEVIRTDEKGTVVFTSDGKDLSYETEYVEVNH